MRERKWLLLGLYGIILLAHAATAALKATRPKFKIATTSTSTTTEEAPIEDNEDAENVETTTVSSDTNATTGHTLTGIPQIDYIWDPNLPRELNGYNLSEYPFYNSIPEEIDFKCDGLHDGFYASVPHKCQVYHHCLYGTRYDFLCANFTAFDQRTFICHFVSEVDCANSKKYWHRNDALYKATTTSTTSTSTTTTTTTMAPVTAAPGRPRDRDPQAPRRRRPYRRRPAYDYYDEDYYDDQYSRPRNYDRRDDYEYEDRKYRRDRDRDFRDRERDFRDMPRPRDGPDREPGPRERFPTRNNRRDPLARPRDPIEEDARPRIRPQEPGSRPRDPIEEDARPRIRPQEPGSRPRDPIEEDVRPRNRPQEPGSRPRDPIEEDVRPRNRLQEPGARPRDPIEEDVRPRNRPLEPAARPRDAEEPEFDDHRVDSRGRDPEDRRYSDKRFRDDYEDKEPAPVVTPANTESLVKPAAPIASLYSRPRTPPKIRRPVPLSEQDKYAYKATPSQPTAEEPRRRPVDVAEEDDYYEDDLEEIRPRRPMRRRPMYRDREREFYDVRDRDRDRPFRPRYRDEEDDIRPRKHPERSRDRFYDRERSRDRSLDRTKDRPVERPLERDRGRSQDTDRPERPFLGRERDRETERPRSSSRSKDLTDEGPRRPSVYDRTTEKSTTPAVSVNSATTTTTTTTCTPEGLVHQQESDSKISISDHSVGPTHSDRQTRPNQGQNTGRLPAEDEEHVENVREKPIGQQQDYQEKLQEDRQSQSYQQSYQDEYSSEYYDEVEDTPAPPPPRTSVRIVKRPFLPSRGGNPNPRGLQPVGSKAASTLRRDEDRTTERTSSRDEHRGYFQQREPSSETGRDFKSKQEENRQLYDAYKVIQSDLQLKQRPEDYELPLSRSPSRGQVDRTREEESLKPVEEISTGIRGPPSQRQPDGTDTLEKEPPTHKWTAEDSSNKQNNFENVSGPTPNRGKIRGPPDTSNLYASTYKNDEVQEQPSGPASLRAKQKINEVTHRLQDIPESEYDVTLNDALTPTLNQESSLPSGFVLPLHRQITRDSILQPSENNYKVSRPLNQQQQQQQQQQLKSFAPSPPFLGERSRTTVYFRTPEAVQVSGAQYRTQRGPWQDYAGY